MKGIFNAVTLSFAMWSCVGCSAEPVPIVEKEIDIRIQWVEDDGSVKYDQTYPFTVHANFDTGRVYMGRSDGGNINEELPDSWEKLGYRITREYNPLQIMLRYDNSKTNESGVLRITRKSSSSSDITIYEDSRSPTLHSVYNSK